MWARVVLNVFFCLLYGCATSGNPAIQDPTILSQIKIGQSNKGDVLRLLGKPTMTSTTQLNSVQHEIWAYGYAKHETNPLIYVPIIGLFAMAAGGLGETQSAGFSVYFNKQGIVQTVSNSNTNITFGGVAATTTINTQSNTQSGGGDPGSNTEQKSTVDPLEIEKAQKPFPNVQGKEGQFYERKIDGDKLLAKSAENQGQDALRLNNQKAILDSVYEDILQRGHTIIVGDPESNARKLKAELNFPVLIKSDFAVGSKIHELKRNGFGKDLSAETYRNFEQRLDNIYFILQLVLQSGEFFACHAPINLTKYDTDGEFLSVDDEPSTWSIKISVPMQSMKELTSVGGRFAEGPQGSACEITMGSK
jgi:outer membrane protein assembly factor BamE (lipoprotein component of BamABCDE complex)